MTFEEYMDSKIPTWKTDVSMEEIENLKSLFNNVKEWQKIAENVFKLAFSSKVGIDYSTDYNKANENIIHYENMLENTITEIRQNLGLEEADLGTTDKQETPKTI